MISIYFPEEPNIQEKTAVRSFWESLRLVFIMNLLDVTRVSTRLNVHEKCHTFQIFVKGSPFQQTQLFLSNWWWPRVFCHVKTSRVRGNWGQKNAHADTLDVTTGTQILLSSLAPSLHWVWVYSYWIFNMKRAPEVSIIFEFERLKLTFIPNHFKYFISMFRMCRCTQSCTSVWKVGLFVTWRAHFMDSKVHIHFITNKKF